MTNKKENKYLGVKSILNETPKYTFLSKNLDEYDKIPSITNEAGEQEDAPLAQIKEPVEPKVDVPAGLDDRKIDAPVPSFAKTGETKLVDNPETIQQDIDLAQNDIIKQNIEILKGLHSQIKSLESTVEKLNSEVKKLNSDVEEVREPSNVEKLMTKKEVSYPYYFGLNDIWRGNWFENKWVSGENKGIRELPDGTFIADYDDLPHHSKLDVQRSFNELFESVENDDNKNNSSDVENTNKSEIDGFSKAKAVNYIYKKVSPLIKGFFSDEDWSGVRRVFKEFNKMNLNWHIVKSEYDRDYPPKYKKWEFEIEFLDNNGKNKTIWGYLVASGGGSVSDPLEKYDIVLVLS